MALIRTIRVQHIRTHQDFTITVSPAVTVITGPNGAGKTSLIEALYIALRGSSFKSGDDDILQKDASWYRIDVEFDDDSLRVVKFEPERITGRKQFIVNGSTQYRLAPQYKYPVVLFEPDDLRLLNGSPVRRRQFIDRFISQLDSQYATAIRRYERALKQRNTLLKHAHTNDDLFAWNVTLSEYGAYIMAKRLSFIQEIDNELGIIYKLISGASDSIAIRYTHLSAANIQQKLLADLHKATEKDRLLGFTSIGPHRHDILFSFNDSPASSVASRGEIRSIILALKFLEVHITERITGQKPIILLDDVFSELDETRQQNLVTEFTDHQIILTSVGTIPIASSSSIQLPR